MAISAPPVLVLGASSPDELRRLWTRDEYYRLAEVGLLDSEERVELLDGELFLMPPQLTFHASSVQLTMEILRRTFPKGFVVRPQLPIILTNRSEPEPDLCVARGVLLDYADHHPGPGEIVLVVEVSDSTLQKDRTRKAVAYARAGLPEYWIVNVIDRQVETFREPTPDGIYVERQTLTAGQEILPFAAARDAVPVLIEELLVPSVPQLESE